MHLVFPGNEGRNVDRFEKNHCTENSREKTTLDLVAALMWCWIRMFYH